MPLCAALNCSNRKGKYFYRFPVYPVRRKEWEILVKRANFKANDNHRLCEDHFESRCFQKNLTEARKAKYKTVPLLPDAVPTLFSFSKKKPTRKSLAVAKRSNLEVNIHNTIGKNCNVCSF